MSDLTVPSALLATARRFDTAPADNIITAEELNAALEQGAPLSVGVIGDIANLERLMLDTGVKGLIIDAAKTSPAAVDVKRTDLARLQGTQREVVGRIAGYDGDANELHAQARKAAKELDTLRGPPRLTSATRERYYTAASALAASCDDPTATLDAHAMLAEQSLHDQTTWAPHELHTRC